MGRYQLNDQIWTIERDGLAITIIEPDGQSRFEEHRDMASASARFTVLTNQKLRAGWKLLPGPPPVRPSPIVHDARDPRFEAAILAAPRSRELRVVYGDWLQQQGDPRGEHIALSAAGNAEALRTFELRHLDYLTGGCADCSLAWGFVDVVRAGSWRDLEGRLAIPATRFATRLLMMATTPRSLVDLVRSAGEHAPETVRDLRLAGGQPIRDLEPLTRVFTSLGALDLDVALDPEGHLPALPRLASLEIGPAMRFYQPALYRRRDLGTLRELVLYLEMDSATIDRLVTAPFLPQLERLSLPLLQQGFAAETLLAHLPTLDVPVLAVAKYALRDLYPRYQAAFRGRLEEPDRTSQSW